MIEAQKSKAELLQSLPDADELRLIESDRPKSVAPLPPAGSSEQFKSFVELTSQK